MASNQQEQSQKGLAGILSELFSAFDKQQSVPVGDGVQQTPQNQQLLDLNNAPKDGTMTPEGQTGAVASVENEAEPWQHEYARRAKEAAMNAVGPTTANAIANGAPPAPIIAHADAVLKQPMGQQALASARQANGVPESGIDQNVVNQIQQSVPSSNSNLMDNLFQTPKFFGDKAAREAMGKVAPNVMQSYMTNQLPLGTNELVNAGISSYSAQVAANKAVLDTSKQQQEAINKTIETEKGFRGVGETIGTFFTGKTGKRITPLLKQQGEIINQGYGSEGASKNLKNLSEEAPATSRSGVAQQQIERLRQKVAQKAPEMIKKGYTHYNFTTNEWVKNG